MGVSRSCQLWLERPWRLAPTADAFLLLMIRVARIICGAVSFGLAALLGLHLAQVFRPVILPGLRQLGKEETTYFVMEVAGFTLRGSQVLLFECALGFLFLVATAAGMYAFSGNSTDGNHTMQRSE
jgi:hypothetical protein